MVRYSAPVTKAPELQIHSQNNLKPIDTYNFGHWILSTDILPVV